MTMEQFSQQIGRAMRRPSWAPMLWLPMKLAMGQRAEVALASQRVIPKAAEESGFEFAHPQSDEALQSLLGS